MTVSKSQPSCREAGCVVRGGVCVLCFNASLIIIVRAMDCWPGKDLSCISHTQRTMLQRHTLILYPFVERRKTQQKTKQKGLGLGMTWDAVFHLGNTTKSCLSCCCSRQDETVNYDMNGGLQQREAACQWRARSTATSGSGGQQCVSVEETCVCEVSIPRSSSDNCWEGALWHTLDFQHSS